MTSIRIALLTTAILLPAPVAAETLGDAYVRAQEVFGPRQISDIVEDLDGVWLRLTSLSKDEPATAQQVDEYLERCTTVGRGTIGIETRGEGFSLHFVTGERTFDVSFDWSGGLTFVSTFDPQSYFAFLGFDRPGDERYQEMRAQALASVPLHVNVYRPDSDILVIVGDGTPDIYGRCPG